MATTVLSAPARSAPARDPDDGRTGARSRALVRPVRTHPRATSTSSSRSPSSSSARWRPSRERPVLLFSGGKDSAVLLHLAAKAFKPGRIPFPVLHVDTGHNFSEVLEYRDAQVNSGRCPPARGQGAGLHRPGPSRRPGPGGSRNRLQTTTLLDAINANGFDAAFGGARRDEDKARAKERVLSFPRLVRAVGPQAPATRALAALPGPGAAGRAPPRLPAFGLDGARHLAVHPARADRAAVHLLRARALRSSSATACCWR